MSSRNYTLKGEVREKAGKGVARALRRENKIPSVIYGDGKPPVSVSLPSKELHLEYLKGHMFTSLCTMEVGSENHLLLARDIQLHPVKDNIIHVDFLRVTPKTKLQVWIPVHFVNQEDCPGLKDGGILNIVRHEIEVHCQATDIPDHIDIDLTGHKIDDVIRIKEVKLPAGAKPVIERDFVIATINEPRRIIEETPAAAEGAEGAAAPAEGAAAPADAAKAGAAKPAADAAAKKDEKKK